MKSVRDILYGSSLKEVVGTTATEINELVFDSRIVSDNDLFVAIKGAAVDGHTFINKAIEKGATTIVCEDKPNDIKEGINYVIVDDAHKTLAVLANNYYDQPSKKLKLIGITGTNGKTTTTTLLYSLFMKMGIPVGLISTVVNKINDVSIPTERTTPDAVSLNKLLAEMVDAGCEFCFMEVSSHAIHQNRIGDLYFSGGAFTNITHEHLDYHNTFKEYINVKKKFFDDLPAEAFAVTNTDDKNGEVMLQNTKAKKITYALKGVADYKAKVLENNFSGLVLSLNGTELYTQLIGDFNAYNILLVYAIAEQLTDNSLEVMRVISELKSVEGRFEYFKSETGVIGIVDYAHTPDALENVLKTIGNIRTGNETVFSLVGCGGDRDKTKRPTMAAIGCEFSDKLILTSDNPRTEDPEVIIEEMMTGVGGEHFKKTISIANRKEAIKTACSMAEPGDIILIAGKGHETYQEINGVKHDFDDLEILKELLMKFEK
ncbi:UDP-N-acetylmuramoyl-L-alanyl-D-glutamate--2,6-diaminopimelate ligase [Brumimicrobium aurantiacum]|uniref:UDP-N-acetylmuramoyl-L-alanyl-D-glutamate--2,6-diaminopimelate ligase n=1 Tax=Brumimicrobium aurantiacum TaxID=1737063 RepID=A0A3E1EY29_9FLAO|nr:UDP-N-acetylmuramoyl-L-alanyl-D-glutamate--2,6-diaminopimelate ligase [Brumimicrobium aurantiacum]RFC54448.1 UDP-N-acetylmuramoyl-L-alanyl-D-glutamate--2,6-diaminopimelate ligase [Brumimicrobium aurantiacum]